MFEHRFEDLPSNLIPVLHPTTTIRLIHSESGHDMQPSSCTKACAHEDGVVYACAFHQKEASVKRKPYLCAAGPRMLLVRRLHCSVHGGEFRFSKKHQHLFPRDAKLDPEVIQFGKVSRAPALLAYFISHGSLATARLSRFTEWLQDFNWIYCSTAVQLDQLSVCDGCIASCSAAGLAGGRG